MRILISSYSLDPSGVPTYTQTLVRELQLRGHVVTVYSPHGGRLATQLPWVQTLTPQLRPDVILAQHTPCAEDLRMVFPDHPMVYVAHGVVPLIDQPPTHLAVTGWIAVNEQTEDYLRHKGVQGPVALIRDFVDPDVFRPQRRLRRKLPHVLFISNYKKWRNYRWLEEACTSLGYPLRAVGAPYRRSRDLIRDINRADLVVSWGRGILEAMSCGRPVLSYDKEYGDGYLDISTYYTSRTRNFSHFLEEDGAQQLPPDLLRTHLQRYSRDDGPINRQLILDHHHVRTATNAILRSLSAAMDAAGSPAVPSPS